jgi:hypothetical protein
MFRRTPLALLTALLLSAPGLAQTARPSADDLIGTWKRHTEGHEIAVTVERDGLRLSVAFPEGLTVSMEADYLVTRDGILVGVLRLRNGDLLLKERTELASRFFQCRFAVEGNELVVREVKVGNLVDDCCKKLVEGPYRRDVTPGAVSTSSTGPAKPSRIRELVNGSEPRGLISEPILPSPGGNPPSDLAPERVRGGIQ